MSETERRVRERRIDILMAGDGTYTNGLSEEEAREIAYSETLSEIYDQDGDHLTDTDPDLVEWLENELGG